MTLWLAGVVLVAGVQEPLDPVLRGLLHLGRHQGADGLWGARAPGCVCLDRRRWPEAGAEPDPATRSRIEALIERLADPDIAARTAAERDLTRIGLASVSLLRAAAGDGDAERAARCRALLDRLGGDRARPDVGLSGLVLLGFLGAGYSHLSKDAYDGVCFGTVVRRGLDGMKSRQRADGAWDADDPVSNVHAALAMSEAYGMTGSNLWKESAEKGLAFVESVAPKDGRHEVWRVLAFRSGWMGDVWKEKAESLRASRERLAVGDGPQARAGIAILDQWLDRRRGGAGAEALAALDPWLLGSEELLLCAIGMRAAWKASEAKCQDWMEALEFRTLRAMGPLGCGAVELQSGLKESVLGTLALLAYWRYGSSLANPVGLGPFER